MAGKFQRTPRKKRGGIVILILLLLCIGAVGILLLAKDRQPEASLQHTEAAAEATSPPTEPPTEEPTEEPTEPPAKVSTATIGATGDILLHELVIKSGYDKESKTYNFDNIFKWFTKYVSAVDYAAANLEVSLNSDKNGFPYSGYPCFNAPDEIVDAAKAAGFDMLLTGNNHTYDMGSSGFIRTQQVIEDRELDHIGTRLEEEAKNYLIRDINGIRIAMTCYTYSTGYTGSGSFMLNGIAMTREDSKLVNAFNYRDLDIFYDKLSGELEQMKADGAEAIVMFIHWGEEYKTKPHVYQEQIGQQLCDMGIDVIVGNHAHVVQPVKLLTSQTDETHKTLCLYSTGNAVSNIYKSGSFPVHTEDGMLFTFTFAKYSDGTVLVESADVLPTWVWRYIDENGVRKFRIMAMAADADWKTEMELTDELMVKCQESFDRTMEIVGEGLAAANDWFAQKQGETEASLGIR